MKTQLPTLFSGATLLALVLLLSQASSFASDSIVAWENRDYVSAWTNLSGLVGGTVTFSDTETRSPGSPYPNGKTSGTFYGGASSTSVSGVTEWRIGNNLQVGEVQRDFLNFRSAETLSGDKLTAIYLWKKTDFLNGFDASSNTNTLSFKANVYTAGTSFLSGSARWLVQASDGNYYVSAAFNTTASPVTRTLDDPFSVTWYSIDPLNSLSTIGSVWTTPTFTNISAVGLWFEVTNTRPSGYATAEAMEGRIVSFHVSATAIPEPASAVLIIGILFVALAAIKRIGNQF